MKIAVTAANGKLGSSVINTLIEEVGKDRILGIVRTPAKADHLSVELRKGDYNHRDELNSALEGIDSVLLISGMSAPQERIQQHRNVIEAAKQNGVKKIVYTSIIGEEEGTSFSPIVQSNRQTEKDIKASGLDWVIGRNGIYIEPDLEYIDLYKKDGEIKNCAGNGKCAYTSREELSHAYSQMLIQEKLNQQSYNLLGEPITQTRLAEIINQVFHTHLRYHPIKVDEYEEERRAELGSFMGSIIAGIYDGIRKGAYDLPSDFAEAAGRPHKSVLQMVKDYKNKG